MVHPGHFVNTDQTWQRKHIGSKLVVTIVVKLTACLSPSQTHPQTYSLHTITDLIAVGHSSVP